MYASAFEGKTVLLTGHTGFKGAWLAIYLKRLGAHVIGYALQPLTDPNLFETSGIRDHITHILADVRDTAHLQQVIQEHRPDFVFHLAAQALVLESYRDPYETFSVNVMGTASVLEAVRLAKHPCVVVVITTDKVYENRNWIYGYREVDPLGGHDPYSASKAAAEIVISSYRSSFFAASAVKLASARAGNVIGAGDWSAHRIIPDAVRALHQDEPLIVRNPNSVRPWQHVLEPLSGYLWLAAKMAQNGGEKYASAWNFGPLPAAYTVRDLVEAVVHEWGSGEWRTEQDPNAPHEANLLSLSTEKAINALEWFPVWDFEATIHETILGYKRMLQADTHQGCLDTINATISAYEAAASAKGLAWTF